MHDYGWPEIFPREHSNLVNESEQEAYPWIFKCGVPGCYWRTAHSTQEGAQKTKDTHNCGMENQRMPEPGEDTQGTHGKSIIEKLWVHLDEATSVVMASLEKKKGGPAAWTDADERIFNESRGHARGLSIAIHELTSPGYADATAVAKHAVARHKAAIAQEEMPATVGIGGYNPHLTEARSKAATATAKKATAKAGTTTAAASEDQPLFLSIKNKGGKYLSENDINSIKMGLGSIPEESLANVYKITLEDIAKIKADKK